MKVRWKPGSRYSYSSVGYTISGYILEKVSGEKYEDFLKQQILNPLEMDESSFYFPNKDDENLSCGYEGTKELPSVFMNSRPAGSMISTVMDFSMFLRFMLNNGYFNDKQIFAETSIIRMETSHSSIVARKGLKIGYGLGLPSYYKNGFLWQGHTGGGPGCLAKYAYCRELDIGYVFMMNSFDMEAEKEIRDAIIDFITKNHKPTITPLIKLDKDLLKQHKGYYEPRNPRLKLFAWISTIFDGVNIKIENDTLILKSFLGKKTLLLPVTENLFRESNEPDASAIFITTESDGIVFQKGNKYYVKTAKWKPWLYRISFILSILFMISVIIVSVIWIPLHLVRKYILKKRVSKNIQLIIFPVLAISSILLGISIIVDQTMVELTQMTNANIVFCISTYLFAGFSMAGVFIVMRDFKDSFRRPIKIYTTLVSLSFLGFTVFLTYWGFIGLRLWSF
jgi:Beta-lactamase